MDSTPRMAAEMEGERSPVDRGQDPHLVVLGCGRGPLGREEQVRAVVLGMVNPCSNLNPESFMELCH